MQDETDQQLDFVKKLRVGHRCRVCCRVEEERKVRPTESNRSMSSICYICCYWAQVVSSACELDRCWHKLGLAVLDGETDASRGEDDC